MLHFTRPLSAQCHSIRFLQLIYIFACALFFIFKNDLILLKCISSYLAGLSHSHHAVVGPDIPISASEETGSCQIGYLAHVWTSWGWLDLEGNRDIAYTSVKSQCELKLCQYRSSMKSKNKNLFSVENQNNLFGYAIRLQLITNSTHTLAYMCWILYCGVLWSLKVIYHPLYGINNYVLIWGDWLSCDSLRGSHDSQSPHIRKHLWPILWQLWFICHQFIHTI